MRVMQPGKVETVGGVKVEDWGGHGWTAGPYLSMACAIGMEEEEMERVVDKLDQCLTEWRRKAEKKAAVPPPSLQGTDS